MASDVPLIARRAASAKGEAYRWAHELTAGLAELIGRLGTRPDLNESIQLHESARLAVGTIVRQLVPAGAVPTAPRPSTDAAELGGWVQLLDELLTDAQAGYERPQEPAPALAASIAAGVDRIARVEEW